MSLTTLQTVYRSFCTNKILFWIALMLAWATPACFRETQPRVSKDPTLLEVFTKETAFPYHASESRTRSILGDCENLKEEMDGDEVLRIMGNPDQTTRIGFYGGKTEGWVWDYFLTRQVRLAPSDSDKYVSVRFNVDGRITKIVKRTD